MAVFAIGADDPVLIGQNGNDACRDRLFPVIEMQETADLFLRVKLGAALFEPADADHVAQQHQNMRPVQFRLV